jgi:hypothetical protein
MARIREIEQSLWSKAYQAQTFAGPTIYVMEEEGGLVKIGVATNPFRRLAMLQCGNPRKMTLRAVYAGSRSDCFALEKEILAAFADARVLGEWIKTPADGLISILRHEAENG